jgi:hypothetical protein
VLGALAGAVPTGPQEAVHGVRGQQLPEALLALDDERPAEGHRAQRGAAHAKRDVGRRIGRARIAQLAGEHHRAAPGGGVCALHRGLHVGAARSVARDHELHAGEATRDLDGGEQALELELGGEPAHGHHGDHVPVEPVLAAEGVGVDRAARVGDDVDRWLYDRDGLPAQAPLVVGDLLGTHHQRHVERQERRDRHRHHGGHGGYAVARPRAEVGLERGRPLVAVDDVDAALGDEPPQRPHHLGRRPPARLRRGHELEIHVAHALDEPARLAEHDRLVAEVAHGSGELDRVQLAAADLEPVGVDDDLHAADSRTSAGSGA